MKGIAHFVSGVAVATFFPEVVQSAAGGSLLPVLGGVFGILPDTLDFKFARYFERYDDEIDPDPSNPDAQEVAERVVAAMRKAYETGKPQNIMLHTMRLGADLWRQYVIRFDPAENEMAVRIGPIVNTGQMPYPGSEPQPDARSEARVKVGVPMVHTYDAENRIDIFSGPSFVFERRGDELHVNFLAWHRRWTHSLTLAAALGLAGAALAGPLAVSPVTVGLVIGLGYATHILEDQLGFMGSNLFFPFTRRRTVGAQLLRSGDAIPNFLTVWLAVATILFNLDRFSAEPRLLALPYLLLAVALPIVVLGGIYLWGRFDGKLRQPVEALRQGDQVAELEEVEV